ncbi:hypothetical protein DL96DRAFT_1811714 [Flagelloscypha sp. PMI_526]|nr:hypothetical protein DL96DRAFT_1811714 [Flagelloscypha sp. PMI_526]
MSSLWFESETISGPSNFDISIPFLKKSDHDMFQAALTRNYSTFSLYSTEAVQNAVDTLLKAAENLDQVITDLQKVLLQLNARKARLDYERNIVVQSIQKPFIPFPIIPLDIVQYIMEMAASMDKFTAKKLTQVSKTVQPWADKYLLKALIIRSQREALSLWTLFNESPTFTARCASWTQCCVLGTEVDQSSMPRNIFVALHNLRSFAYWRYPLLFTEQLNFPSSPIGLRRLSLGCNDTYLVDSSPSLDMTLPLFQNLTHLELISLPIFPWEQIALDRLLQLTHMYLDIELTSAFLHSIVDGLIPLLPMSIKIVTLDYGEDKPNISSLELYDGLRTGKVHSRVLLSARHSSSIPDSGVLDNEWIYFARNIEMDEWALSGMGGEMWWQRTMEKLQERNHALGLMGAVYLGYRVGATTRPLVSGSHQRLLL